MAVMTWGTVFVGNRVLRFVLNIEQIRTEDVRHWARERISQGRGYALSLLIIDKCLECQGDAQRVSL